MNHSSNDRHRDEGDVPANHQDHNPQREAKPASMDPASMDKELQKLVAHACDDVLDAEELSQLADLLRTDSSARRAYLRAMGIETILTAEHADSLLEIAQSEQIARAEGAAQQTAAAQAVHSALQPTRRSKAAGSQLQWSVRPGSLIWPKSVAPLRAMFCVAASLLVLTLCINSWSWLVHDPNVMQAQSAKAIKGKPVGKVTELVGAEFASDAGIVNNQLVGGQTLRLLEGVARFKLNHGASVTVEAPAELEIVSSTLMNAQHGIYRATAGNSSEHFVIRTPSAQVVNVGPDLTDPSEELGQQESGPQRHGVGVEISETGSTDVVVFDGQVSLQLAERSILRSGDSQAAPEIIDYCDRRSSRQLGMGEAIHIERSGKVKRIFSLVNSQMPSGKKNPNVLENRVIDSVYDDNRDDNGSPFYQVVPGGFGEDARAYVDRFHEWNGLDESGLPAELRGADYVMTFNRDKWAGEFNMHVNLIEPATLYLFIDNRTPLPAWLTERFQDTGFDIGLDEGWQTPEGGHATVSSKGDLVPLTTRFESRSRLALDSTYVVGTGASKSIDATFSVWSMTVRKARQVTLGPPGQPNERTSMYGIAATRITAADATTDAEE